MAAGDHFDTIVVGSGFGGSVSAYRLSQGGQQVCVLERGKAYPPGSFARRPRELAGNFWEPGRGLHGLYNVWSFRHIEALVSSGLGGGSLIYANVLLRKDERWFVNDRPDGGYDPWPIAREDLERHYQAVETMMDAQAYPFSKPPYNATPKTRAMQEAAASRRLEWDLPPLAVTFANPGEEPAVGVPIPERGYPNLHGLTRTTCRLCGECNAGCNYGSKNTLDHNYLSAARHHGADIRTRCEVRRFEPRPGGGFTVGYIEHLHENEGSRTDTAKLPVRTLTCDRLIIAAGTFGSTYLLLRNRPSFPGLSPALGTRFCGNGDLLGFVLKCRTGRNPFGPTRVIDGSLGPVITSYVRVPDRRDGGDGPGYYVEDAGYPVPLDWMVELVEMPSLGRRALELGARRLWYRLTGQPQSDLSGAMSTLIGKAELSSGSLTLLGMGRDVPDGVMTLKRGYLDNDWSITSSRPYFDRMKATMGDLAKALNGRFLVNPSYFLKRVITVHPLGGCPMGTGPGDGPGHGVVDSLGRVFNYPGLYVADGSVMPGPVGPNPALTIAAFADRMAEQILAGTSGKGQGPTP